MDNQSIYGTLSTVSPHRLHRASLTSCFPFHVSSVSSRWRSNQYIYAQRQVTTYAVVLWVSRSDNSSSGSWSSCGFIRIFGSN